MSSGDNRHGTVSGGLDLRFDIEFLGDTLLQGDGDAFFVDHPPTVLDGFGCDVAQHLQLVLRASDRCPECHGDRKSDHPRAGDPDAHGVLEDVGAQPHRNPFGFRAQGFGGPGYAQRHGDGFGTSDGGDDLPLNQADDLFAFRNRQHMFGIWRNEDTKK